MCLTFSYSLLQTFTGILNRVKSFDVVLSLRKEKTLSFTYFEMLKVVICNVIVPNSLGLDIQKIVLSFMNKQIQCVKKTKNCNLKTKLFKIY